MALANVRFRQVIQEKTRVRTLFEQYVSPEVAELLISSGSDLLELGAIQKVTIFFADIRESTSLVQHIELDNPNLAAVQAAQEIKRRFADLRVRWITRREDFKRVDLAMGISCGEVFIGNVGSSQRFDFTVIGTAVNVAQRVATASPSGNIHITGEVMEQVAPCFQVSEVGFMKLRGVENRIPVFSVGREKIVLPGRE